MALEKVFHGPLVQVTAGGVSVAHEAWVGVGDDGKISFATQDEGLLGTELDLCDGADSAERIDLAPGSIMFPGFVDAHLHAPQYAFLGIGTNVPLMEWLEKYTFPFETKCRDDVWAQRVYTAVVRRTLGAGTTTASYFATIHNKASVLLAQTANECGQRAFVGKVSMDRNAPVDYVETTDAALADAEAFVKSVRQLYSDRVQPILTPRFVPTCSSRLMSGLAKLAVSTGCPVQTHVSENLNEIAFVRELHPECSSYTGVYAAHGLLTPRTLLAHGVHLEEQETKLISEAGSSVVHCPLSNFSLTSGVCNVRALHAAGVNVALGTDISGGGSASMFSAMQMALVASQVTSLTSKAAPLGWRDVLKMATLNGAKALGMESQIGGLTRGQFFDAVVLRTVGDIPFDTFSWESTEELAEKIVISGDDRNVASVYVRGEKVVNKN